jgi:hypothetical protein
VYPVVLGSGDRLFDELTDKTPLRLAKAATIGDGFAFVTYEVVRNASLPRSETHAAAAR